MATIKNTTNALGNLINVINAGQQNPSNVANPFNSTFGHGNSINIDDDSIPSDLMDIEPVFTLNYKSTKKQCIKKAKQQLEIIVKSVVPTLLQNSPIIVDKIAQDAFQLGNLYYEYEKADKITQACMETIAKGETQARLFEVFQKLSKNEQELASKITDTQNQMRKYYIDTYLDLQQKGDVDENMHTLPSESKNDHLSIENNNAKKQNIIVGTDNTIKMIAEKKKQAMIAKYNEIKDNE